MMEPVNTTVRSEDLSSYSGLHKKKTSRLCPEDLPLYKTMEKETFSHTQSCYYHRCPLFYQLATVGAILVCWQRRTVLWPLPRTYRGAPAQQVGHSPAPCSGPHPPTPPALTIAPAKARRGRQPVGKHGRSSAQQRSHFPVSATGLDTVIQHRVNISFESRLRGAF